MQRDQAMAISFLKVFGVIGVTAVAIAASCISVLALDPIADAALFTVKTTTAVDYPFGSDRKTTGRGAGFLIDRERGWILTNAHVAKRSPSIIRVSFQNHPYVSASKVYVDNHLDMAVIKVDPKDIPSESRNANLNCTEEPKAGLPVIAFGHPWSLDYTATRGIVSGSKDIDGVENLQTDAALNPGNSGGPLIDEQTGVVVGINAAGLTKSEGLNFAVPIKLVCTIVSLLKDGKDPSPPIIPISFATTLKERELVVANVKDEWADKLKIGDRILAVNGDKSARYISRLLDKIRGAEAVTLVIARGGKATEVQIKVPEARDQVKRLGVFVSGMTIGSTTITGNDKTQMFIQFIDDASEAEQSQFLEGDIVTSIDGIETKSHQDVLAALEGKLDKRVEIIFKRERSKASNRYDYMVRSLDVISISIVDENGLHDK
jgi:S1-C subfamily serine protease